MTYSDHAGGESLTHVIKLIHKLGYVPLSGALSRRRSPVCDRRRRCSVFVVIVDPHRVRQRFEDPRGSKYCGSRLVPQVAEAVTTQQGRRVLGLQIGRPNWSSGILTLLQGAQLLTRFSDP